MSPMTRLRAFSGVLLVSLATPASALAAEAERKGKDYTVEIMIGLILFLMAALIVIGILEQRKSH